MDDLEFLVVKTENQTQHALCVLKNKMESIEHVVFAGNPLHVIINCSNGTGEPFLVPYTSIQFIRAKPFSSTHVKFYIEFLDNGKLVDHNYYVEILQGTISSHFPYLNMNEELAIRIAQESLEHHLVQSEYININYIAFNEWGVVVFGIDRKKRSYFAVMAIIEGGHVRVSVDCKTENESRGGVNILSNDFVMNYSFFNLNPSVGERNSWRQNEPFQVRKTLHMINGKEAQTIKSTSHF